jgi:folate-binding protein YgfZ
MVAERAPSHITALLNDALMPVTGVAALTHFGLLQFAGADAAVFLQGQLSCDVNALQPGQAVYGSYNTPKGRMLASFLLWRDETGFTMQLPRSVCEATRRRLSMHVLRSKVTVRDASDDYVLFGTVGNDAMPVLASLIAEPPAAALALTTAPQARLLRLDSARVLIVVDRERGHALTEALTAKLHPLSTDLWDWTDIRAGIPYITPATQDQFVPQMANLDLISGVSFTKGCYPGQEIVARMHYLGKLKQRMYLTAAPDNELPQPGDKLYSPDTGEQATGMIVNAARGPDGRPVALAVMHIESFKRGEVHLKAPAGPRLEFMDLPYSIPS